MRYFILFSILCVLLQSVLSQTVVISSVTPAVISQAKSYSATYQYSIIPPSVIGFQGGASMVMWWTPDVTKNQIHIALMGAENQYVALGFNNQSINSMIPGYAVIAGETSVQLYSLVNDDGSGSRGAILFPDQSNIEKSEILNIDGYVFATFTWVMVPPLFFPVDKPMNLIWATRAGSGSLDQYHDNRDSIPNFNFMNPQNTTGYVPVTILDCGVGSGSTGNVIPWIGKGGSCTCPPSFTLESNCHVSSYSHNYTFMAGSTPIVTMYWNLNGTNLDVVVQRIIDPTGDPKQWAGIAFCQPSGMMGPSDAIVYPHDNNEVYPVYLSHHGADGVTDSSKLTITNSESFTGRGGNFFSFTRALASGQVEIADVTSVPMIAARSSLPWQTQNKLNAHNINSNGAALLNLETGVAKPPPFVWTQFVTHGLLMWICWGIIIPIGFLWARFIKGYPNDKSALWFEGHRTLMSIGFIIVIVSAVYAIALTSTHVSSTHTILGATVVACALYQVMSAVMRPHADPTNPSPQRLVFEYTHHFVGRSTIVLAWVAIAYGLMKVNGISMSVVWGHIALSVIWLVTAFVLEIRKAIITRRLREYENLNRR